jgi:hypothetical protein
MRILRDVFVMFIEARQPCCAPELSLHESGAPLAARSPKSHEFCQELAAQKRLGFSFFQRPETRRRADALCLGRAFSDGERC